MNELNFSNLDDAAVHIRNSLDNGIPLPRNRVKNINQILLFAYNGTGKTRLSMAFKDVGKLDDNRDTLYFNAFTEDLFRWDNDLENDQQRVLKINQESRFFNGLQELEMENRIRPLLQRYADFDFFIDYDDWVINFTRDVETGTGAETIDHIKVSRGEENIFVWCFFLAVAQLAVDQQVAYDWVKYLYIDDPISSLDDNNAIAVASHLAQLLKNANRRIKTVISSHHTLFFNVMWNELNEKKKLQPYFLSYDKEAQLYKLRYTNSTPFFHHVALLEQLHQASETGNLYTYHFNILRSILEKTATFHGFKNFSACIEQGDDDPDGVLHARIVNILSHGNYSLFEPMEMTYENKSHFRRILNNFLNNYRFNPELFPETSGVTRTRSEPRAD
ncbi:AAA family ATPase [Psychrosphaera haliotis]|uniref:AAA family ATPase n=1 Tax=Psychrosphaera haliotis TaxID=555083 RepID=A0A6N8F8R8_9GAMM|nr:AAA family ATPase [Psychrosphaera haliotis]MUH72803.1 AAA family ATPase [Psychrosphaera haliotis]